MTFKGSRTGRTLLDRHRYNHKDGKPQKSNIFSVANTFTEIGPKTKMPV